MPVTPKIRPMLWFDGQAEEAAKLYVSIFPGSKILERPGTERPARARRAR